MQGTFILLTWLAILLAAIVVIVGGQRRRSERALRQSFARHQFHTLDGPLSGTALRVVKASHRGTRHADPIHRHAADAFWYCVGPGRSYYLAIAVSRAGTGHGPVHWVLRPLTEQAMRGALVGDRKAALRAFGQSFEA